MDMFLKRREQCSATATAANGGRRGFRRARRDANAAPLHIVYTTQHNTTQHNTTQHNTTQQTLDSRISAHEERSKCRCLDTTQV